MLHASKVKHACVWFMVGIKYKYCMPLKQESDDAKKILTKSFNYTYDFCPFPSPVPTLPQAPSLSHYPSLSSSPKYNNSILREQCDVSPSVLTFLSAMNMPIIGGRVHPCQETIKLLHH